MSDKANHELRRQNLIEKIDGTPFLVSNLVNIRYLTGFTGSNAFLLISDTDAVLLTDGRYTEQCSSECPDLKTQIRPVDSTMLNLVSDAVNKIVASRILIESDSMTRAFWRDLVATAPATEFADSSGLVESLRAVKDDHELGLIRKSIKINEEAFQATLASCQTSWSELEFSWELEKEIRQRGGIGFSFDPIVAVGKSSALPHYHAGAAKIQDHPLVLVDWGTSFESYASDLTRVIASGKVANEIAQIRQIVADAKAAACDAVKDGAEIQAVDSAARNLISEAGYGDQFNHGLGHGFGLEIHEPPFISPAYDGTLRAGMVITIEPGIYLPGIGGIRLEDDILVTETGFERLNELPDDFFAI
jgi:Xaa-Pro aminopeptidase